MKRVGNLWEKIVSYENLLLAHKNASKGKKNYREVKIVNSNVPYYINKIREMLISGTYKTSEYDIFTKQDKRKLREIYRLPYFPDRIVHWAIMQVLEPIFDKVFIAQSCASIPKKGIHKALRLESNYLKDKKHTKYCLKLDVKKFFPSIDQNILMELLRKRIKDNRLLNLLEEIVFSSDRGVPIGNYLSQYFANFYLTEFDHYVKEVLGVKYYIRYMDDIVVLGETKEYLFDIFKKMKSYLNNKLNLEIKSNWQVFPVDVRGIDFVGYRHFRTFILLRKSTCIKFKHKIKRISKKKNLSFHDYCSVNSYLGWLIYCNGRQLIDKYIVPLKDKLYEYEKLRGMKKHCAKRFYQRKVGLVYAGI